MALRSVVNVLVVLSLVACDGSSARMCQLSAPAPTDWRLAADGTHFRDGMGRTVYLRGVNAGGRSKFAPYMPFAADGAFGDTLASYMDRAASWGIDAMRVPFTWAALEPTPGRDDADWLARYDQLLDAAWQRGIWTIVDFHQDVYSEVYCGDGFPAWTVSNPPAPHHDCPMWFLAYFNDANVIAAFDAFWAPDSPVMTSYVAAWDRMVARYRDKPGVVGFEPINEPASGSADNALFARTTLTDFYSMMVARMRAAAPSSLVFVDTTGLDGVTITPNLRRPSGDGIVFAPHHYPVGADPDAVLTSLQTWATVGEQWSVPVLVGEFGASNDLDTTPSYMDAQFDALDALGASGTQWEYSVANELWNSEANTIVAADGIEYPVVAGATMRAFARAVAGTAIVQRYDVTRRVFELSYDPSDGITEVQLPSRAFPAGYTVDLEGACYDDTSQPGRMLIAADPGAARVTLRVFGK
jgi:endoglycosylceramidase